MTSTKRILFLTFLAAMLLPYIGTLFFIRTASLFILLPLDFLAFIVVVVTTIFLIRLEEDKARKKGYSIAAIGGVLCFFFSYGYLLQAADILFFKQRESRLEQFVEDIRGYSKIKEMNDGQRYWKSINHISVESSLAKVDTTHEFGRKYYLPDILARQDIALEKYEAFRKQLISVNLTGFVILEDGTISFTIDGFLDNCTGYAYSKTGIKPEINDCGQLIHWKKVADNWYVWYTT